MKTSTSKTSIHLQHIAPHSRVAQVLSNEQLLDKVQLVTPLFSFQLKQLQQIGQTTIRNWELTRRQCKVDKKRVQYSHAQKRLTKHEEQEIIGLYLSRKLL